MNEQTLETAFDSLDEIVEQLETEEVSLEESFALYHKGMELLKLCNEKIDKVEKQIRIMDEDGGEHEF